MTTLKSFINNVPLNQGSQDELRVNFLEYWEVEDQDTEEPNWNNYIS